MERNSQKIGADTFTKGFYDTLRSLEPHRPRDWILIVCVPGKGGDDGRAFFRVVAPAPESRTPEEERMLKAVSANFYRGRQPQIARIEPVTGLGQEDIGMPKDDVPF